MRVPKTTALIVFALFAGVCGGVVAYALIGGAMSSSSAAVMAALSAGVVGCHVMPRFHLKSVWPAMAAGAFVAWLSHFPFSILWGIVLTLLGTDISGGSGLVEFITTIATFGFAFAAIPEGVLGAIAGAVCFRRAVVSPEVA